MLDKFIQSYYSEIAQKIEQQQITFGLARIHSHRHIARCIIYSDWYCNTLNYDKNSIERMKLYFAIAFHDMGREGELEDVWEAKSRQMHIDYLKINKLDKYMVNDSEILNDIIHDVDCLDIMRSGTGRGGIMGFDRNYLNLFKEQLHLQGLLISSAWKLISLTDSIQNDNIDCLAIIHNQNKNEWKIQM
jgi:hypothetical protein